MNRAARRRCAKAKQHLSAKVMPDASIVCLDCGTLVKPAPSDNDTPAVTRPTPDSDVSGSDAR